MIDSMIADRAPYTAQPKAFQMSSYIFLRDFRLFITSESDHLAQRSIVSFMQYASLKQPYKAANKHANAGHGAHHCRLSSLKSSASLLLFPAFT